MFHAIAVYETVKLKTKPKKPFKFDYRVFNTQPLEKYCFVQIIDHFQVALTRWYVVAYGEELKKSVNTLKTMVSAFKQSFKTQIQNSAHLSTDSKQYIVRKLDDIKGYYGYLPGVIEDTFFEAYYRDFTLYEAEDENESFGYTLAFNVRAWEFLKQFQVAPVADLYTYFIAVYGPNLDERNKIDWLIEPNAFYQPNFNTINIQISALSPPWFSNDYPPSVSYGALGYIIGHEIGHAFDSSQLGSGLLTESDLERVRDEYRCLVRHYGNYTVDGFMNEGNKTLTVADIVGINMAYDGLLNSINKIKFPGMSNVTDEQLYFIAAGQNWCSRYSRNASALHLLRNIYGIDSHTIDNVRVNAMMAQSTEFQDAFKCSATSKMNAQKKCTLWKREYP